MKILTSSNNHRVEYFLINFAHVSHEQMSTKRYFIFVLFSLDLELFAKIFKKETLFLHIRRKQIFHVFINNSRSKETEKKNPEHSFIGIVK